MPSTDGAAHERAVARVRAGRCRAMAAASMLSGSALARRRGGGEQVAQELRVAAGALGGEREHVRRRAARPPSAPRRARAPAAGSSAERAQARRPAARRGAAKPDGASRRVVTTATGGPAARRRRRRAGPPTPRPCGGRRSICEQRRPVEQRAQEAAARTSCSLAPCGTRARARATSGVGRDSHAERDGEQRQPRRSSAGSRRPSHLHAQPREHASPARRPSASRAPARSSSRQTPYGVEPLYASHGAVSARRSSAARARPPRPAGVLPMPGSPAISTSRPSPRGRRASAVVEHLELVLAPDAAGAWAAAASRLRLRRERRADATRPGRAAPCP